MSNTPSSRRLFLQKSAAVAGLVAAPTGLAAAGSSTTTPSRACSLVSARASSRQPA